MKLALVTGANKGIGYETARQLALQKDTKVLMGGRSLARVTAAAAVLQKQGLDVEPLELDVTDSVSIKNAATAIQEQYGKLDILVNNAGIARETMPVASLDVALFKEVFATNLFGVVEVTQQLLPLLEQSVAGRIVNVSSTLGSLTEQTNTESGYYGVILPAMQASKAALNSLTIGLSKLLKDKPIKVNSACPGWVKTDLGGESAPTEAVEAVAIICKLATLDADGPSGGFFDATGAVAW